MVVIHLLVLLVHYVLMFFRELNVRSWMVCIMDSSVDRVDVVKVRGIVRLQEDWVIEVVSHKDRCLVLFILCHF